jgi:hypothetical protein
MQDRSFDIAGPNPTPKERNRIDRAYMGFLDIERRENVSAELAKSRTNSSRRIWKERVNLSASVGIDA